jgi:hypothetical protein
MASSFDTDVLIQAQDPRKPPCCTVTQLGFEITDEKADLISLDGEHLERGVALGSVLEVTVENVEEAKARLVRIGGVVIKDEPNFPRCYVKDPYGLTYNLTI